MSHLTPIAHKPCFGCAASRAKGRTTCFWCGMALGAGRDPSDSERFETSPEGRMARIERSMSARREPEDIDACVAAALAARAGEFTHDELVADTGLNACAIKFSLERLQGRGVVRAMRRVQVRSQRFRTIWRVVAARAEAAADGAAASGRVAS
jgi:hypothetical protein